MLPVYYNVAKLSWQVNQLNKTAIQITARNSGQGQALVTDFTFTDDKQIIRSKSDQPYQFISPGATASWKIKLAKSISLTNTKVRISANINGRKQVISFK